MRNLVDVIELMLAEIPPSEESLLLELRSLRQSCCFTAPEQMKMRWQTGAETLQAHFGDAPNSDWQKRVVNIWMNTPNDCP